MTAHCRPWSPRYRSSSCGHYPRFLDHGAHLAYPHFIHMVPEDPRLSRRRDLFPRFVIPEIEPDLVDHLVLGMKSDDLPVGDKHFFNTVDVRTEIKRAA